MPKGRYRWNAGRPGWKGKVENRISLDARRLQRKGLLKPGSSFGWQWSRDGETYASIGASTNRTGDCLILDYRWTPSDGEPRNMECSIHLETTPCQYGGGRTWFTCPRCGGRCAIVYYAGARFACRQCLNLAYSSQSDDANGRTWRKQRKIEGKLSGGAGEWNGWRKPKGMHQETFDRLRHQIYECEQRRDELLCLAFMRLMPHFR